MYKKRWSRPRWATIFCRMQIYAMTRKKAQNSAAQRGRLHGEIKVWKLELVFCKYFCTSYLGEIFERVQFVPFSLLCWLRSVDFIPYKYRMRRKSIWNIWTRIKWEAKLASLKCCNGCGNWPNEAQRKGTSDKLKNICRVEWGSNVQFERKSLIWMDKCKHILLTIVLSVEINVE